MPPWTQNPQGEPGGVKRWRWRCVMLCFEQGDQPVEALNDACQVLGELLGLRRGCVTRR